MSVSVCMCLCLCMFRGGRGLHSKIIVKGTAGFEGGEFPFSLCSWAMWPGWVWAGSFHFPKCNNTPWVGGVAQGRGRAYPHWSNWCLPGCQDFLGLGGGQP